MPRCVPSVRVKRCGLGGHAQLLVHRQARARYVQQGVLLRRVHRHVVLAAHRRIDEFDDHVRADPLEVAIAPLLKGVSGRLAAAFFHRPLVGAARGMRLDFVRRSVDDVDSAAIRLPARNARRVALVGVGDAPVVLFLELVLHRVRRRVAPQPELLDELLPFLVRAQVLEDLAFFVRDDVDDVFVQPLLVRRHQLLLELLRLAPGFLLGHRLGQRLPLRAVVLLVLGLVVHLVLKGRQAPADAQNQRSGEDG